MESIIYVGMDVHTTNYTLCCYSVADDRIFAGVQVEPDYHEILKYLARVEKQHGKKCQFLCGYEAGCLGYSLYHQLRSHGIDCVILAPTTMMTAPGKRVKTDRKDAERISKCLAFHTYSPVHIPTEMDDAVKEYIRMRDDGNTALIRVKQQIIAFCTRHGKPYTGGKSYWTKKHIGWLYNLKFENSVLGEVLQEYLILYFQLREKVDMYDARIMELSQMDAYLEPVQELGCLRGIAAHTALSLCVEVGDFRRFATAQQFASYLGLTPGECSSGDKQHYTGITKAGNSHLRKLLVEAAQTFSKSATKSGKSAALKERQAKCDSVVVAYADKANERLKRKYFRIAMRSKANVAKTAVARELACFIWGLMTDHIV